MSVRLMLFLYRMLQHIPDGCRKSRNNHLKHFTKNYGKKDAMSLASHMNCHQNNYISFSKMSKVFVQNFVNRYAKEDEI